MKKEHVLGLVAICLVIVVLSVSGLASDVLTRLDLDLDGLLLIMVSLLMAGLFLLMLFLIAKEQGWLPASHKKESRCHVRREGRSGSRRSSSGCGQTAARSACLRPPGRREVVSAPALYRLHAPIALLQHLEKDRLSVRPRSRFSLRPDLLT